MGQPVLRRGRKEQLEELGVLGSLASETFVQRRGSPVVDLGEEPEETRDSLELGVGHSRHPRTDGDSNADPRTR